VSNSIDTGLFLCSTQNLNFIVGAERRSLLRTTSCLPSVTDLFECEIAGTLSCPVSGMQGQIICSFLSSGVLFHSAGNVSMGASKWRSVKRVRRSGGGALAGARK
jgi:hypothetical protein